MMMLHVTCYASTFFTCIEREGVGVGVVPAC